MVNLQLLSYHLLIVEIIASYNRLKIGNYFKVFCILTKKNENKIGNEIPEMNKTNKNIIDKLR